QVPGAAHDLRRHGRDPDAAGPWDVRHRLVAPGLAEGPPRRRDDRVAASRAAREGRLMFAEVPLFPEQASTIAGRVDGLLYFLVAVTGSVTLLVTVLILYFAVKYRRRSDGDRTPRILGSFRLEMFWTVTPLFV